MSHAHEPRHCTAADVFTITEKPNEETEDFLSEADEYLKIFVAPVKDGDAMVCFHCGSPLDSFKAMLGIGAAIEWGLVHGEGRCSGMKNKPCGWPYRGMHYAKRADGSQLFDLTNFFLAYHPDGVSERKKDKAA